MFLPRQRKTVTRSGSNSECGWDRHSSDEPRLLADFSCHSVQVLWYIYWFILTQHSSLSQNEHSALVRECKHLISLFFMIFFCFEKLIFQMFLFVCEPSRPKNSSRNFEEICFFSKIFLFNRNGSAWGTKIVDRSWPLQFNFWKNPDKICRFQRCRMFEFG